MKELFQKAINKFGIEAQVKKTIEELDELKNVLSKRTVDIDDLKEEFADTMNMLHQVAMIFDLDVDEMANIGCKKMKKCLKKGYKAKEEKEVKETLSVKEKKDGYSKERTMSKDEGYLKDKLGDFNEISINVCISDTGTSVGLKYNGKYTSKYDIAEMMKESLDGLDDLKDVVVNKAVYDEDNVNGWIVKALELETLKIVMNNSEKIGEEIEESVKTITGFFNS